MKTPASPSWRPMPAAPVPVRARAVRARQGPPLCRQDSARLLRRLARRRRPHRLARQSRLRHRPRLLPRLDLRQHLLPARYRQSRAGYLARPDSLSHGERVGVRGDSPSIIRQPAVLRVREVLRREEFRTEGSAPHPVPLPASSPWRACNAAWPHPQADAAGERGRLNYPQPAPSPPPNPLADLATLGGKLAKASLPGEGTGVRGSSPSTQAGVLRNRWTERLRRRRLFRGLRPKEVSFSGGWDKGSWPA